MGLDIIELVMRTEETFGVNIEDGAAGQIQTVGDLYEAICKQLDLSPDSHPDQPFALISAGKSGPHAIQTADNDVWTKLVAIISDQLQIDPAEVRYDSRFREDLGADHGGRVDGWAGGPYMN